VTTNPSNLAHRVVEAISQGTYRSRDLNMAKRLVGADDAEDVVQEAYLKAFRFRESYHGDSAISTWLYRIVRNTALNHIRDQRRPQDHLYANTRITGETAAYFLASAQDDRSSPEAVCIARDFLSTLQAALDAADDIYASRKVIGVAAGLECGMSAEEIAKVYGIGPQLVAWYASVARKSARDVVRRIEKQDAPMVADVERDAA